MNSITFLGTGTSQGIPVIGCNCPVCRSADSRDKRLRCSALIDYEGKRFLIDAGPDFRTQMLRENIQHLDAILLTHSHVDHTGGLDDVRSFNHIEKRAFPIYCETSVQESLHKQFYYVFSDYHYPGAPQMELRTITSLPFRIDGVEIVPVRAMHYKLPLLGFRFGSCAYITDANYIPESEFDKLAGLDILVLNTVKMGKHISHFSLQEVMEVSQRAGARRTFITHLSHLLPCHEELSELLPDGIEVGYDGLKIEF